MISECICLENVQAVWNLNPFGIFCGVVNGRHSHDYTKRFSCDIIRFVEPESVWRRVKNLFGTRPQGTIITCVCQET